MTDAPFGIRWAPGAVDLTSPPHVPLDLPSAIMFVLVAVVCAVLTRRRPSLGIAALVVLAPFAVARYLGPTTITVFKAGVAGVAAAILSRPRDIAVLKSVPIYWIFAGFGASLAAIALSAVAAADRAEVLREFAKTFEYAVIFTVGLAAYAADPDDRAFWRSLEIVVALVCVGALAQYLVGAHSGIVLGGRAVPRIAGPLEGPNQLAGYLEVALPVMFARTLLHRGRLLAGIASLAALVDILTFSRAGIVSAVVGCAVVLSATRVSRSVVVRVTVVGALALAIFAAAVVRAGVPAGYYSLGAVPADSTHLGNRSLLWRAAIELWRSSPFVGVGAGNYELLLDGVGLHGIRTHANNLYLQTLAETGLAGLAALGMLYASIIAALVRSPLRRPVVVGALGATFALLVHQCFDDLAFFPKVMSTYWLLLAIALAEIAAQRHFARRHQAFSTA